MNIHPSLYDVILERHRELLVQSAQAQSLAELPVRPGLRGRLLAAIADGLIAIGTALKTRCGAGGPGLDIAAQRSGCK